MLRESGTAVLLGSNPVHRCVMWSAYFISLCLSSAICKLGETIGVTENLLIRHIVRTFCNVEGQPWTLLFLKSQVKIYNFQPQRCWVWDACGISPWRGPGSSQELSERETTAGLKTGGGHIWMCRPLMKSLVWVTLPRTRSESWGLGTGGALGEGVRWQ